MDKPELFVLVLSTFYASMLHGVGGQCPGLILGPWMVLSSTVAYPGDPPIIVKCNSGYKLDTDVLVKYVACVANSTTQSWNDTVGTCVKKECPELEIHNNNTVITNTFIPEYGAIVQLQCEPGYVFRVDYLKTDPQKRLVTTMTVRCLNDGYSLIGRWSPLDECTEPVCKEAPAIQYATAVTSNVTIGSLVTYRCLSGFVMKGELRGFTAVCNQTVSWQALDVTYYIKVGDPVCELEQTSVGCVAGRYINGSFTADLWESWLGTNGTSNIIQMCKDLCIEQTYTIAAIRNSTCICGSLDSLYLKNDTCFLDCLDNDVTTVADWLYCGGEEDDYSVFSTFDGCYDNIDPSEYNVTVVPEVTAITCRELCRGQGHRYAVSRLSTCFCVNERINNATEDGTCLTYMVYDLVKFIPESQNCSSLFDSGVQLNGQYVLTAPHRTEYCLFKDGTSCEDGWIGFRGNCYHFANYSLMNFNEAREYCRKFDADIPSFTDQEDLLFFSQTKTIFPDMRGGTADQAVWWLGLIAPVEGMYTWLDGSLLTYQIFTGTEPDINIGVCADNYLTSYRAANCTKPKRVVCRKGGSLSKCITSVSANVDFNESFENNSLTLCSELCKGKINATHALVNTTYCLCVWNVSGYTEEPVASCNVSCPGNEYQICGGTFGRFTYFNLSNRPSAGSCKELQSLGFGNSTFLIQPPGASANIQECGIPACPISWIELNDTCYKFVMSNMSEVEAATTCSKYDSYRVVLETQEELSIITDTIHDNLYKNVESWWIGLTARSSDDGVFMWDDGKSTVGNSLYDFLASPSTFIHAYLDPLCNCFNNRRTYNGESKRPICEKGKDYFGCYVDDMQTAQPVLQSYSDMTIQLCVELCRAANKSVALLAPMNCSCADNLYNLTVVMGQCTSKCKGQHFQPCGGPQSQLSAYDVGQYPPYSSCDEMFDAGIFWPGLYLVNETYQHCNMYDETECAPEWVGYSGSCYKYYHNGAPSLFDQCAQQNATMTSVTNIPEYDMLTRYLRRVTMPLDATYRISSGLTRAGYGFDVMMNPDGHVVSSDLRVYSPVLLVFLADTTATLPLIQRRVTSFNRVGGTVCKKNEAYIGCYEKPSDMFIVLDGYSSMTLTLCRQLCLANGSSVTLMGKDFCACAEEIDLQTINASSSQVCVESRSIQKFEYNGDGTVVLAYFTGNSSQVAARSCLELYINGVFFNTTYIINNGQIVDVNCGFADKTICSANWIGNNDICYKFIHQMGTTVSNKQCFNDDSFLVSATDPVNVKFVSDFMSHTQLFSSPSWQTGIYCLVPGTACIRANGEIVPSQEVLAYTATVFNGFAELNRASLKWQKINALTSTSFVCQKDQDFLGCFTLGSSVTGPTYIDTSSYSLTSCLQWCQGQESQYAAVSLETCQCLDNDTSLTKAVGLCTTPCKVSPTQSCGGINGKYTVVKITDRAGTVTSCSHLYAMGVKQPGVYRIQETPTSPLIYLRCFEYPPLYHMINPESVLASSELYGFFSSSFSFTFPLFDVWRPASDTVGHFVTARLSDDYLVTGIFIAGLQKDTSKAFVKSYKIAYLDSVSGITYFYEHLASTLVPSGCNDASAVSLCYYYMWHPVVTREITIYPETWYASIAMQGLVLGQPYDTVNHTDWYIGCVHEFEEHTFTWAGSNLTEPLSDCVLLCRILEEPFASLDDLGNCYCSSGWPHSGYYDDTGCPLVVGAEYRVGQTPARALYRTYEKLCRDEPPVLVGGSIYLMEYPYVNDTYVNATYTYGTLAHYRCNEGWESTDVNIQEATVHCNQSNQWSPLTFSCQVVYCPVFDPPLYGYLDTSATELIYGSGLTLTCDKTFYVDGGGSTMTVTCQQNHAWTAYPTCKRENHRRSQIVYGMTGNQGYERLTTPDSAISARSHLDCASRCHQDFACLGYNFLPQATRGNESCRLFSDQASLSDLVTSANWLYWERQGDVH